MLRRIIAWIKKHRHDEELCGVLQEQGRYTDLYRCCETGEFFRISRAMTTMEMMMAREDEKKEQLDRLIEKEEA